MGLIAQVRYSALHCRDKVLSQYWRDGDAQRSFGDYANIVLRDVWREIDDANLASTVVKQLKGRKRILVFLPPVAEETDCFVSELRLEADKQEIKLIDFRSQESAGSQAQTDFKEFATSKERVMLVTVDRFSEGVSVNDIDALVMLRATLSPRIAVQALGRGVRLADGKQDCLVVDAVGLEQLIETWDDTAKPLERDEVRERLRNALKEGGYAESTVNAYLSQATQWLHTAQFPCTWRELQSQLAGRDVERWSHTALHDLSGLIRKEVDRENAH